MGKDLERAHSDFSASGTERWLNCPGSVKLSKTVPPVEESEYAMEGTRAHECLEILLKSAKPFTTKKELLREKNYTKEMVEHAWEARTFILNQKPEEAELRCETKVYLNFISPNMFGTLDAAIIEPFGTLHIFDYKYGAGIAVEAAGNFQMAFYALAIAHEFDFNFSEVKTTIIQPRADHERGPIRTDTMSIGSMKYVERVLREGFEKASFPEPELKAGQWCRWCPAKTVCPAISSKALEECQVDFRDDHVGVPEPQTISSMELGKVLKAIEKVELWIDAVKEHAFSLAQKGNEIPGYKLVEKRSTRKWVDEEEASIEARKKFKARAFKEEFLSPAQLEKAVKGDPKLEEKAALFIASYASNKSSGLTLAPEGDKRPAITSAEMDFKETEPKQLSRNKSGDTTRSSMS